MGRRAKPKSVEIPEPAHHELEAIIGEHGYGYGFVWTKFLHKPTGDILLMKTDGVSCLKDIYNRKWFILPESIEARQLGLIEPGEE